MAKQQQPVARKQSRSKRAAQGKPDVNAGENGHDEELAGYEKELASYLQERIKPGLNSGAIPLLARSIAKEIAHRERPNSATEDAGAEDKPSAGAEDKPSAEADDEQTSEADADPSAEEDEEQTSEADDEADAEADDEPAEADGDDSAEADDEDSSDGEAAADFEANMHELQEELGDDWILRFSVKGDEAWLTAEKDDGSQRLEAPTAQLLTEVVGLLNEGGGRSG
jgi:hypothetical protein